MDALQTRIDWLNTHRGMAYALFRAYVGLALFFRGILFLLDSTSLAELVAAEGFGGAIPATVVAYIAVAHLLGGLMLAAGFRARLAALVQLPILIGAVFFVHLGEGLLTAGQSLELSGLVLFLLVVFLLFGAGPYSFDHARATAGEEVV